MKFVNFQSGNGIRLGIKTDQGIIDIKKAAAAHSLEIPSTIEGVIAEGEGVLAKLAQLTQRRCRNHFRKKRFITLLL